MSAASRPWWKYLRLVVPAVIGLSILLGWLVYLSYAHLHFFQTDNEDTLEEWLNESRPFRKPLPEVVREYLELQTAAAPQPGDSTVVRQRKAEFLQDKREEIHEHLKALGNPTRIYTGRLPLFPEIYYLELRFEDALAELAPIMWDSQAGPPRGQEDDRAGFHKYRLLGKNDGRAVMCVSYRLHTDSRWQRTREQERTFALVASILAAAVAVLAVLWGYVTLRRERQRELQAIFSRQQIEHAERQVLENQLRRQEAERKQEETERQLLEQRLAAQAAEGRALELKSQLYASIGIMAGSYAHNIKNLLVRPNDLLRRCLDDAALPSDHQHMLQEVRETLGTVTERLQQILQTVRRDPSRSEMARLDLGDVVRDLERTWKDLALDKWKLQLTLELAAEPLPIEADRSHLQQMVENLLFNARDATFEMRSHLRGEAHRAGGLEAHDRRQALIAAAAWRGQVVLRTYRDNGQAVLEVRDNGIGMTEEVRRRCVETHFSTKRDNAIYEGHSTGMGLGLSFVAVILEHHRATMAIDSGPLEGTAFRLRFPLAAEVITDPR